MSSVIAVVEEQGIEYRRNEISRVVPGAVLVGLDVLYVIEDLNHEKRDLLRQHVEEQRLAPIEHQHHCHEAEEYEVLADAKPECAAIFLPQLAEEPLDVRLLVDAGHRRVYQEGEQVVPLEKNGRSAAVPRLVVVLVVILIVRWHPSNCRVAVVNRNHVAG